MAACSAAKPADGEIEAYRDMESHLCDCVRWIELADTLSLGNDRPQLDMVVHHATEEMRKLLAAYYDSFEP